MKIRRFEYPVKMNRLPEEVISAYYKEVASYDQLNLARQMRHYLAVELAKSWFPFYQSFCRCPSRIFPVGVCHACEQYQAAIMECA